MSEKTTTTTEQSTRETWTVAEQMMIEKIAAQIKWKADHVQKMLLHRIVETMENCWGRGLCTEEITGLKEMIKAMFLETLAEEL